MHEPAEMRFIKGIIFEEFYRSQAGVVAYTQGDHYAALFTTISLTLSRLI